MKNPARESGRVVSGGERSAGGEGTPVDPGGDGSAVAVGDVTTMAVSGASADDEEATKTAVSGPTPATRSGARRRIERTMTRAGSSGHAVRMTRVYAPRMGLLAETAYPLAGEWAVLATPRTAVRHCAEWRTRSRPSLARWKLWKE